MNNVWYGGIQERKIVRFEFDSPGTIKGSWKEIFSYEDLKGEHLDGIEVINFKDEVR